MTPLQLARAECANWERDGECLGMDIATDGRTVPLWQKKPARCRLADGQACAYFETAILAGIPMMGNERKANEWQEAADMYNERKAEHEHGGGLDETGLVGKCLDGTPGREEEHAPKSSRSARTADAPLAGRLVRRAI